MEGKEPREVLKLLKSLGELPEAEATPSFIVISGLPGVGKSYFSARLAEKLPVKILESDALRKVLFPSPTYRPSESAYLFKVVHLLIERLLEKGVSLVLDATNLSERYRERLYNIAERLGARLILVQVMAPPSVVYERLKARAKEANGRSNSDADWGVYQKMKPAFQKIRRHHFVVDTSRDITPVLDKIVREARR